MQFQVLESTRKPGSGQKSIGLQDIAMQKPVAAHDDLPSFWEQLRWVAAQISQHRIILTLPYFLLCSIDRGNLPVVTHVRRAISGRPFWQAKLAPTAVLPDFSADGASFRACQYIPQMSCHEFALCSSPELWRRRLLNGFLSLRPMVTCPSRPPRGRPWPSLGRQTVCTPCHSCPWPYQEHLGRR